MTSHRRRSSLPFATLGLIACASVIAACSSVNQGLESAGQDFASLIADDSGPSLAPAPLPRYAGGQRFSYSDGRVERVVSSNGKQVTWKGAGGERFTTDRNFVVPKLSSSLASTQHSVINGAGGLWPLAVGKADRMRIGRSSTAADGSVNAKAARNYNCRVSNTAKVSVPAGSFDTYRVQCTRFSGSGKRLVETRVWHYAPAIGHYVRYEEIDRKTGIRKSVDLVDFAG